MLLHCSKVGYRVVAKSYLKGTSTETYQKQRQPRTKAFFIVNAKGMTKVSHRRRSGKLKYTQIHNTLSLRSTVGQWLALFRFSLSLLEEGATSMYTGEQMNLVYGSRSINHFTLSKNTSSAQSRMLIFAKLKISRATHLICAASNKSGSACRRPSSMPPRISLSRFS